MIHVVYDASAKSEDSSLNECLHIGPKFNQRILEILLRFRFYRVALVADIEKVFLMVSITPKEMFCVLFGLTIFRVIILSLESSGLRELCLVWDLVHFF